MASEIKNLISVENCSVRVDNDIKVNSFSWHMKKGEAWLVIGPNGGGKADFIKALAGMNRKFIPELTSNSSSDKYSASLYSSVFEGSVEIVSLERAASLIEEEREQDETDYMDRIDEGRTGRRFICEVLGGSTKKNAPLPPIASKLETLPQVKLCGIEKILDRGLRYMSTGEIRRTLLCRALLSGKKLLVLSDPFAGLDADSRKILLEFFNTIVSKQLSFSSESENPYPYIILSMERMVEIPESINKVLEFSAKNVSFCGDRAEYEKLITSREEEAARTKAAEKEAFAKELSSIHDETAILKNEEVKAEDTLIKFNKVHVGWNGHMVLNNLDWTVKRGEHWLVRGPNGSGKTTLLELVTGDNQQVYCNDIWLFGRKRGTGETIWEIKSKLGIVSYRLHVEYRMVGGFDLESVIISGFHDSIGLYEPKTDVEKAAARKWLKLAGFEGRENDSFSSLSYGEQRAVLILRAAVKQPPVLILDEPCHGLDENFRQKILNLMELIAQTGTTTLLHVTHDPTEVLDAEKHILELHPGEEPMYKIITK
ncbi:MAG: ATP-binding cassette domain-containing protein [Treponema sp.]|nr:ATP-binding cassette domain-containing protein [Treponema sp.]